jgi:hypothetical protein
MARLLPVARRSELGVASRALPDARLRADMLEARDVRPPPLGSRSESIMLPPTRGELKKELPKAMRVKRAEMLPWLLSCLRSCRM